MSSTVTGTPSDQSAPVRSVKSTLRPSGATVQDWARSGTGCSRLSRRVSPLKIRLVTVCAAVSSSVVLRAMKNGLSVVTSRGRPRVSVPPWGTDVPGGPALPVAVPGTGLPAPGVLVAGAAVGLPAGGGPGGGGAGGGGGGAGGGPPHP